MAKFIIEGDIKLQGKIKTSANKNAVLPCMAATLLTDETCCLENVPLIRDVFAMADILKSLGAKINGLGTDTLEISTSNVTKTKIDECQAEKLRASVLLLGPLLARFKSVSLPHPGGDVIGRRSIDTHIAALKEMGANFTSQNFLYKGEVKDLTANRIFLDEASVTATENAMMAACLAKGNTVIKNAASEPHIICLAQFLKKMGADIEGEGTSIIKITGKKTLHKASHFIRPDHIEAGTWAILGALTGGVIEIQNVIPNDVDMILMYLSKMGVNYYWKENIKDEGDYEKPHSLIIKKSIINATPKIDANIWPAFPTDLISPMIVLATQAKGTTLIHDWMYEGRMFFVDKLIRMGADIIISDPHRVVVTGPTKLTGREIISPDIRAGIALVIAALCSSGKSVIHRIELIERGYEKIEERLSNLGADIKREEEC